MTTKQELLDAFVAQEHVIGIEEPRLLNGFDMADGKKYERYRVGAIARTSEGLIMEETGQFAVIVQYAEMDSSADPGSIESTILSEDAGWLQIPVEQKYKATEQRVIEHLEKTYPGSAFFELTSSNLEHGYAKVAVYSSNGTVLTAKNVAVYSNGVGGLLSKELG